MKTKYIATVNVRFHLLNRADEVEAVFVHRVRKSAFRRDMRSLIVGRALKRVLDCAFQTLRSGDKVDAMLVPDDYRYDPESDFDNLRQDGWRVVTLCDETGRRDWNYASNFHRVGD